MNNVIHLDPALWRLPLLRSCPDSTRSRMVDLIVLMQGSTEPGYAVGVDGSPLSLQALAQQIGCAEADLKSDLDLLLRAKLFAWDGRGALYSIPLAKRMQLRQKRQRAGRAGGNPMLRRAAAL